MLYLQLWNGDYSKKQTVDGIMILDLCISTDDALYIFTKLCRNILHAFKVTEGGHVSILKITKGIIPLKILVE